MSCKVLVAGSPSNGDAVEAAVSATSIGPGIVRSILKAVPLLALGLAWQGYYEETAISTLTPSIAYLRRLIYLAVLV